MRVVEGFKIPKPTYIFIYVYIYVSIYLTTYLSFTELVTPEAEDHINLQTNDMLKLLGEKI